jgi:hypothetical protein
MAGTPVSLETRAGRLRQSLRNPTVPVIILLTVLALAIPAAIFGPGVVRRGTEGYRETQRLRGNPPIAPAPGTWINPFLRDKAERMMNATSPIDWRAVSFQTGPCHPGNLSLLPKDKWSEAIVTSCGRLNDIQLHYAADCAETGACAIPMKARQELQGVIDYLIAEFEDAGLVVPYSTQEQGQ